MSSAVGSQSSSSRSQACLPCSKRKVRCDREDPCSNCKRRKTDTCVYPDLSPTDRVKKLEALVRILGGDPENIDEVNSEYASQTSSIVQSRTAPLRNTSDIIRNTTAQNGTESAIVKEDDNSVYVES